MQQHPAFKTPLSGGARGGAAVVMRLHCFQNSVFVCPDLASIFSKNSIAAILCQHKFCVNTTLHFVSAAALLSKYGNPTQNLKRFCVNTTSYPNNNGGTTSTSPASGSAAPQSCGIFAATRPRWAPKGLTLGACSIFRGSGAAGASAALQLAAASQAAGCSCGAPAQRRQKKRRICAPLCAHGGCM